MSDISNIDINNVKYNLKDEVARTNSQSFVSQLTEERNARLATSVVSGEYNSSERKIELKNASGAVVSSINASAFVKDGMVSSVTVTNGNLVISFNTDAGQTPISIPLTSIFDPANYYNKTDVDNALGGKQDTINDLPTIRSGAAAGATAYQKPQGGIPATDLAPDAIEGGEFATGEKVKDVGIDQFPQHASSGLINSKAVAAHGSAFDISEYNKNGDTLATYTTLADALAAVPDTAKRGGMSIKFVQDSGNKYVQFRYMGTATTGSPNPFLDTANWQGVDDEPTVGSDNLVKSGGVYNAIAAKSEMPLVDEDGFHVIDENFNIGMKYDENGLDAAKISNHFVEVLKAAGVSSDDVMETHAAAVEEDGFFIADESLNVGIKVDNSGIHAKNILEYEIIED